MATAEKEMTGLSIEDLDNLQAAHGDEFAMELDKDVNPFEFPAPPDDGSYTARVTVKKDGVIQKENAGGKYLQMNLQYRIVDPEGKFDNRIVFDGVNTINFKNNTNTMYGLALALGIGDQVPSRGSSLDLAKLIMTTLADEDAPFVTIKTRWEASARIPATVEGEKDTWNRTRGQRNFPEDGKGGNLDYIEHNGEQIKAQARVASISALRV